MTAGDAIEAVAGIAEAILPSTSSPVEKAVLAAELARIATVDPRVIATIWNPATCPAVLLPWLAQGVSVDIWSDDWPDAQKRQVIAASPMIHRLKGTLGAIRRALAAFDLETRVVEWWEDGERRGTFRVEIVYGDGSPVFDVDVKSFVSAAVDAAKPKSRVFKTRAVIEAHGRIHVSAFARSALIATAHPFVFAPPPLEADIFAGAIAASFVRATAYPKS